MKITKFRAWDGESKKMFYWSLNDLLCRFGEPEYQRDRMQASPFFIWMQFTGLYDLDGKEIYEDDVVEIWNEDTKCSNFGMSSFHKVSFDNGVFGFATKVLNEKDTILLFGNTKRKVVGNIWENQELIKKI